MNVSATSVSAAISQLEEHFNVQLFVRHHSRGLLLTDAGKSFFASAKDFFEQAERLEDEAQRMGKVVSGVIYAGCFVTLAPVIIPAMSNAFTRKFPDSRIAFTEYNQASLLDALRDGIIQMAFTYEMGLGRNMVFEAVGEASPYCILPSGHRLAGAEKIDLAELAEEPMILLDLPMSREYFQSLFDVHGIVPKIAHRTTSAEVVRSMVAHGLGYSILATPGLRAVSVDGTAFQYKPLAGDPRRLRVGILTQSEFAATHVHEATRAVAHEALESMFTSTD